jgi:hypothetical protein
MRLVYTKDISGNELLEDEHSLHQIMMEWEKPYMEKCIELLKPHGSVLEIGFGLGYSATKFCSYSEVTSYTIIECSPIVWEKIEEFKNNMHERNSDLSINIIKGRWQDVLSCAKKYDAIFFDDYVGQTIGEDNNRFNIFLYECLKEHTKIGSVISVYSNNKNVSNAKCIKTEITEYKIDIPENCNYARGNKMYIPIFTKIGECEKDLKENLLGTLKLSDSVLKSNEKFKMQLKKFTNFIKNKCIYCNLMIIDNFYTNAMETRKYVLTQDFKVRGNYPGQRTESHANEHLKTMIEGYISHFAGKITKWPTEKEAYNGAFQYTTSRDRTWIHNDGWNNWAGVLYLTPNAPVSSGTGIFRFKDGTRTVDEADARGNKQVLDDNSQDYTKWEMVDQVGNIFNRLVLFNSKQYHASLDYFGTGKEDGRLFQVFFFSTER